MKRRCGTDHHRFVTTSLALAAVAASACGTASAQSVALAPAQAAIVDRAAATARENVSAQGIALTVTRDGAVVYAKGFGVRDAAHAAPFDSSTIVPLGPVTKQFTAAAIELLVVAGKVSPDARVSAYLPGAPHASEIRVRDLLHDTSGLPDYFAGNIGTVVTSSTVTPRQLLDTVAGKPLRFAPGSHYEASPTNAVVLGAIVEAASGMTYADFVHQSIAVPLGLGTLTFGPPVANADLAVGYGVAQTNVAVTPWTPQSTYAAGGLYASEADVAKWDAAFFGYKLLPKTVVDDMTKPVTLPDGTQTDYAAGSFVDTIEDRRHVWQHGGTPGASTLNCWFPDLHVAVVIFGDTLGFDPSELLRDTIRAVDPGPLEVATESVADTAKARLEYGAWESGTIDLRHYSADMQALILSPAAADLSKRLRTAGDPTGFRFERRDSVPSGTAHRYRVDTPTASYDMTLTYAPNGTIVQINFTRIVTGLAPPHA